MSSSNPNSQTLDMWIAREAISISADSIDPLLSWIGDDVDLLAFGEPFHATKSDDVLQFRNRLFERLVAERGFSAIAIESSFPRGREANEFVLGSSRSSLDEVLQTGFSHRFGEHPANRALIEWMRRHNESSPAKVRFYGFDSPTEMTGADSPRQLLYFALDYFESIDTTSARARRSRIDPLLDQNWEAPGTSFDPSESVGLSSQSTALRIETEDFITELSVRAPELIAKSDTDHYDEAVHYARHARQMLDYHAALARTHANRIADCLGLRDLMMAENLRYIVEREHPRGKVFAFAHNSHLQRGPAQWNLGDNALVWWPAGAHVDRMLGSRYAVIGSAVGALAAEGIAVPEPGTLEARLRVPGQLRSIPTHRGHGLPAAEIAALPTRSGSTTNFSYFPLTPERIADFDALLLFDSPPSK